MESDNRGGIHALIVTLDEHFGSVQRDLVHAGLAYEDLGAEGGRQLSFAALANYVTFSPPNTAIYHARNEGWTRGDHFAAMACDGINTLLWLKTEDATKPPELQEHRPKPIERPGVVYVEPEPDPDRLTAEKYMQLAGYDVVSWEE